ncbi:chymotrypsin-2-like [Bombyx mori]|uniref:Peptidase S1 domain-containing protein n=1 Tax=Bombyx mori TaxID=7091 RepID=A0A8R2HN02_BOMMO|nr:chymotrypsin-2-like [Bombyx mori]
MCVLLLFYSIFFIINHVSSHNNHSNVEIIGGDDIPIHKAPYMASLRYNRTLHYCGASIIHKRFLITAAHCILPNITYNILVGTSLLDRGGIVYDIEKFIVHEAYSKITKDFDISLIKLKRPLEYGPNIAEVPLADGRLKLRSGNMFSVTGWGVTDGGAFPLNLRQAKVAMVSRNRCQIQYWSIRLTSRMICAGGVHADACQGDSGGPLTYKNVQVGISSFGHGCGILPGVYTKISPLLPWIEKNIARNL